MIEAETRRISWLRPKNGRYVLVTMTRQTTVKETVALQSWLRPALTHVGANQDYAKFREQLDTVDALLRRSHLESMALDFAAELFALTTFRPLLLPFRRGHAHRGQGVVPEGEVQVLLGASHPGLLRDLGDGHPGRGPGARDGLTDRQRCLGHAGTPILERRRAARTPQRAPSEWPS